MPELGARPPEETNLLFDEHISALKSRHWKPTDLRSEPINMNPVVRQRPHYRRRALIGFLTMFFVQCSGMLVITTSEG